MAFRILINECYFFFVAAEAAFAGLLFGVGVSMKIHTGASGGPEPMTAAAMKPVGTKGGHRFDKAIIDAAEVRVSILVPKY